MNKVQKKVATANKEAVLTKQLKYWIVDGHPYKIIGIFPTPSRRDFMLVVARKGFRYNCQYVKISKEDVLMQTECQEGLKATANPQFEVETPITNYLEEWSKKYSLEALLGRYS